MIVLAYLVERPLFIQVLWDFGLKISILSQVQWLTTVIPITQEKQPGWKTLSKK
jgi:hypothetical protein